MTKKLYVLVSTLVGAAATAGAALVTYYQPANATAWVASIGIAATAINDIMLQFIKEDK